MAYHLVGLVLPRLKETVATLNKKKISKNEYLMAKQIVNIYEKQQK